MFHNQMGLYSSTFSIAEKNMNYSRLNLISTSKYDKQSLKVLDLSAIVINRRWNEKKKIFFGKMAQYGELGACEP